MELIDKVGVELEGGYSISYLRNLAGVDERDEDDNENDMAAHRASNFEITTDGSLTGTLPSGYDWREIRTRPVDYSTEWHLMSELLDTLAPFGIRFNHTCGFHIHVSMKTRALYSFMARPSFVTYMKKELQKLLTEWINYYGSENQIVSRFQSRLAGGNNYCRSSVRIIQQLQRNYHSRYAFLNYCYGQHTTLECRVFPMMPASMLQEAVEFYTKAILKWPEWNKLLKPKQPKYFVYTEEEPAMNLLQGAV
jgi:Putative amidoligase enzyme